MFSWKSFADWVGQRIYERMHGPAAPALAVLPVDRRRRAVASVSSLQDPCLYSMGGGYGAPHGYSPPPKPSSGGGATVAIIVGIVLVVVLGGGVLVCGGVGFFAVRSSQRYESQMAQATADFNAQAAQPPQVFETPIPTQEMPQFPSAPDAAPTFGPSSAPGAQATTTPGDQVTEVTELKVGDKLLAEWAGRWHSVEVLELRPSDGHVKIHWDGWSESWDEYMPRSRLRLPAK